jgi:hypothetical protein
MSLMGASKSGGAVPIPLMGASKMRGDVPIPLMGGSKSGGDVPIPLMGPSKMRGRRARVAQGHIQERGETGPSRSSAHPKR